MADWMSAKEAAKYTGYTPRYICYLLANGLLEGRKLGRDWFTTQEALDRYLASDPRPGPKKRK
jgi:excisionase family DNA binding protein